MCTGLEDFFFYVNKNRIKPFVAPEEAVCNKLPPVMRLAKLPCGYCGHCVLKSKKNVECKRQYLFLVYRFWSFVCKLSIMSQMLHSHAPRTVPHPTSLWISCFQYLNDEEEKRKQHNDDGRSFLTCVPKISPTIQVVFQLSRTFSQSEECF